MTNKPNRRRAIGTIAGGVIGAATSSAWVASLAALARQEAHSHAAQAALAAPAWTPKVLDAHQNELVAAISELIIPATDTPGAKAVGVNRFVDRVLQEAPAGDRKTFLGNLAWIDRRSRALYKQDFLGASPADQTALLTRLSAEGNPDKEPDNGRQFFQAIKSMTINGYYTSEVGLRRELGDDGQLFMPVFTGCTHPEHQP